MSTIVRLLAAAPLWLLHGLGVLVGWLTFAASPTYRRRLTAHTRQAGLSGRQRRGAVAQAGKMALELPRLWLRPADRPLGTLVRWSGTEHIDAALARGRGLLYLTPHLGCFEITAQALAERYGDRSPITVLYRPARQPWLRQWMEASRQRPGLQTAPTSLAGVRQMIRALRRGESVGLLPDQVPPEGQGAWAPFFGRRAYTMTLATRLAQQTGATVLLIWGERLDAGRGYAVHVEPAPPDLAAAMAAPPDDPAGDPVQCAAAMNRAMEHLIRQRPEQYLWGYHRYKSPKSQPAAAASTAAAEPAGPARADEPR